MKRLLIPFFILTAFTGACGDATWVPTAGVTQVSPTREPIETAVPKTNLPPVVPSKAPPALSPAVKPHTPAAPRPQATPLSVEQLPAFQPVRDAIAEMQAIERESVVLASYEPVTWPDSCLGLGRPDESCLLLETPGYLVFFDTPEGQVEAHLDRSGRNFRIRPALSP